MIAQATPIDLFTGQPCKPLDCDRKSFATWARRYPTAQAWIDAHPGQPVGRVVFMPDREAVYYCDHSRSDKPRYSWVFRRDSIGTTHDKYGNMLRCIVVFDSFADWMEAQGKSCDPPRNPYCGPIPDSLQTIDPPKPKRTRKPKSTAIEPTREELKAYLAAWELLEKEGRKPVPLADWLTNLRNS